MTAPGLVLKRSPAGRTWLMVELGADTDDEPQRGAL
jgi:hypothetical protein